MSAGAQTLAWVLAEYAETPAVAAMDPAIAANAPPVPSAPPAVFALGEVVIGLLPKRFVVATGVEREPPVLVTTLVVLGLEAPGGREPLDVEEHAQSV